MGKKAKTAPTPDYKGIALEQNKMSKENLADQLRANRPTQVSADGTLTWEQDPTTGEWTQTSKLAAPNQQLYDTQLQKKNEMLGNFDTSTIDFSGAPKMGEVGQFNQQATDLFNQLAQPGLDRQVNSQRARAAAMGIPEFGSRAGDSMNQQLGDLTSRSGMMGAQKGIDQGNIMFDQQNRLHTQGINDIVNERQANLNNMQGLFGLAGQQGANPQFNQFTNAGLAPTPDLTGAAQKTFDAEQAKLNAQAASKGGLLSTIAGIAGTALGSPMIGMVGSGLGGLFGGSSSGGPVYDGGYSQGTGSSYGGTYDENGNFIPYRQGM